MVCTPTVAGFFFLMIRRPPRSPLFPCPTLFRSGLKLPLPEGTITTPKLTVPVGVVASAGTGTVPRTVAVRVPASAGRTEAGLQRSVVVGGWIVAVTANGSLVLLACVPSPAYVAL